MNFLITGALGHIGSKLIRYLPKKFEKSNFYLIDDLRTQRYISLTNLPKNSKFKFYDDTISNKLIENVIKKVDVVIHLAATTDAASSIGKLNKIKKNNYANTKLISDKCLAYKKNYFYFINKRVWK